MNKKAFLFLAIALWLAGCTGPSDIEIGQSVLSATPIVFLVSMGFQYLFFRIWKRKWPELTMSFPPNLIFLIALVVLAIIFPNVELLPLALLWFGASCLKVLLLVTRIWLFFDHANAFTWATVLMLSLYILPAFPMVAGLTEGTGFGDFAFALWVLPGSILRFLFRDSILANGGAVILFLVLLVEAWFATRSKAGGTGA